MHCVFVDSPRGDQARSRTWPQHQLGNGTEQGGTRGRDTHVTFLHRANRMKICWAWRFVEDYGSVRSDSDIVALNYIWFMIVFRKKSRSQNGLLNRIINGKNEHFLSSSPRGLWQCSVRSRFWDTKLYLVYDRFPKKNRGRKIDS